MIEHKIISLLTLKGCRRIRVRGGRVTATCPNEHVHTKGIDKHPSFSAFISNGPSYCQCFSCGFDGVLEKLAHEWGYEGFDREEYILEHKEKKKKFKLRGDLNANLKIWGRDESEEYYKFLPETAIESFMGCCPRYILNRGISLSTAQRWSIGYDKKNLRVIFVVRDLSNRLCGVSGRSIINQNPKMLHYSWDIKNSKLEPFIDYSREDDFRRFKKSDFLFGEHLVTKARRDLVIVEGHVDAIKIEQAGFNVVALMGTQFNEKQIKKIIDLISTGQFVILMLDGDRAGREATKKLEKELDGVLTKKVKLPDNTDPGDFNDLDLSNFITKATIF